MAQLLQVREPDTELEGRLLKEVYIITYQAEEKDLSNAVVKELGYNGFGYEIKVTRAIMVDSNNRGFGDYVSTPNEMIAYPAATEDRLVIDSQASQECVGRHFAKRFDNRFLNHVVTDMTDHEVHMFEVPIKSDHSTLSNDREYNIAKGYVSLVIKGHAFFHMG